MVMRQVKMQLIINRTCFMKKIVYLFALVLLFASCEKNEIGGTATEAMSGQWYVHIEAVDENGDVVFTKEDMAEFYELESVNFIVLTYNTSDNSSDVLFVDDLANFWTFKTKTDCNLSLLTFAAPDPNKYVYAIEYGGEDGEEYAYNNFYYKAGKFDAEKWKWYKEGVKKYEAGSIEKDSLDKMLTEYFEVATDTVSAEYFTKYAGKDFEIGIDLKGDGPDVKNACNITITDGKILKGAATTPSGMPADSIVFYVEFDDDYTQLDEESDKVEYTPTAFGFKNYRISGYRYTGFTNDD